MRLLSFAFLTYGAWAAAGKAWAGFVTVLALMIAMVQPVSAQTQGTRVLPLSIVAFGDSLTQGYGLFDEEGFVPQMRDWLAGQGQQVRLINAGVSGDTTAGGLSRVDWTLTPDVHGMILALGGNDVLRGLDPAVTRANIEGILKAAQAAGVPVLLVGMQAPGNYGPEFKAEFEAIWPELAQTYGALYFESFFKGLGQEDLGAAQAYFQADGIHPNAEGVTLIVQGMGASVVELIEASQAARKD